MFSVIIPTMWKSDKILEMIARIVDIDSVKEIIVINNEKNSTPESDVLKHSKVKIHESETNLFVCPSWNLGAKLSKYPILCFCQDDITFDVKVFDKVKRLFEEDSNVGVVGSLVSYNKEEKYQDVYSKFFTDGSINLVLAQEPDPSKRPPPTGAGNLFFIKKEDWIDIPNEIKIFHGELLIWNYYDERKRNYIITNFDIKTNWHTTWTYLAEVDSNSFSNIQLNDQMTCEKQGFRF